MNDFIKDFPALESGEYIYFDNAATTQRPRCVTQAIEEFYRTKNANPLRGLYEWSINATQAYEDAREKVAQLIGAAGASQIVFTRNATESINLVARTYGEENVGGGDEIAVCASEHHSNILPWQMLAEKKGAKLLQHARGCSRRQHTGERIFKNRRKDGDCSRSAGFKCSRSAEAR